jgi:hypothetical protein
VETLRTILEEGQHQGVFRPTNPLMTHLMIVGSVVFITSVRPFLDRIREQILEAGISHLPTSQLELADVIHDQVLGGLVQQHCPGESP